MNNEFHRSPKATNSTTKLYVYALHNYYKL